MRVLSRALSCLSLLGVVPIVGVLGQSALTPVDIQGIATYTDPVLSNHGSIDTVLEINDIHHKCVSNLVVKVHIPDTSSPDLGNSHYIGDSFDDQIVSATSKWSTSPTTVHVSWDGTNTFTFSNFIFSETSHPGASNAPGDPWLNLQVSIADTALAISTLAHPLQMVFNSDYTGPRGPTNKFISLTGSGHFKVFATNDACTDAGVTGDPVFAGFQGQNFQFHGLPDEHFNLVSSPDVQLNSHFVYLSSGKCDYTDTACFSHAGTYMDALGLSVADAQVKVVAGTHAAGLRVWLNDEELNRGTHMRHITNNVTTSQLTYHHNGRLEVHTDIMRLEIVNSDMFFNIRVGLNDKELLHVGATKHTVTDHAICRTNTETNDYQLVESTVAKKYNVTTPLHGLIGQTWRNVKVCGRDWMGTVEDYVVSDLFSSDSHYNYFNWAV